MSTAATAGPTTAIRTTVQAMILCVVISFAVPVTWNRELLQETQTEHQAERKPLRQWEL